MTFIDQVLHVLKNDLRRFALPLLGIGGVIAIHIAGYWPTDGVGRMRAIVPIGFLPLGLGALAAVAVQRDSPFDDRAFWTTRPVDAAAMLWGKLAFVALLIVAPVGIEALWFAGLGAGRHLAPMLLDSTLLVAVVVCGAAACGSMTRSLRGGLASALAVFMVASLARRGTVLDLGSIEPGIRASQIFFERTAWVLIGVGVVSHQYLTRSTKRSLGIAAVAVLVGIPAMRLLQVDLTSPLVAEPAPVRDATWPHADDLELYLVNLRADQIRGFRGVSTQNGMMATFAFEGGSGAILGMTSSRSRIFRTGEGDAPPLEIQSPQPMTERLGWRFVRPSIDGMELAAGRRPVSTQIRAWIAVEDADGEDGILDQVRQGEQIALQMELDAFEPRVIATLSARPGARAELPGGDELIVQVLDASPRTLRAEVGRRWQPRHLLRPRVAAPLREEISFALRSRKYNEYIMDTGGRGVGRDYSLTGGARLSEPSRWLEFEARFAEGRDGEKLPDDWFEDVELVVLVAEYAGSFTKTITREITEWPRDQSPKTIDGYPPS